MATHYADSAGLQGTGDGSSAANACTLVSAITNNAANVNSLAAGLNAGDTIYCKNGTTITFNGAAAVFATLVQVGTTTAPIRCIGYASTVGDGGIVQITDSNAGATNNCFAMTTIDYWHFENFKLNNVRDGWSNYRDGNLFVNCAVYGHTAQGWESAANTGDVNKYIACIAANGLDGFASLGRSPVFVNCVAINNSGDGFRVGNANYGAHLTNCIAHKNGDDGFVLTGECTLINCVSNRNTGDGYEIADSDHPTVFVNCGATSNGGYGVNGVVNTQIVAINCGLNPTNESNTSGEAHANVTLYKLADKTGDPDFTDSNPVTATNVDLSLSSTSAWKAAGLEFYSGWMNTRNYQDVGVAQRQEAAAGGGLLTHPGWSGGMRG